MSSRKPHWLKEKQEAEPVSVVCLAKVAATAKASLYTLANGEQQWFPRSVIEDEDRMDDGTFVLSVSGWFAEKERLHEI